MPRFGLEIIFMLDKDERKELFDASKSRFPFIISLFTFVEMPFMLYMFLCIIDQNLIQRMNMMVVAHECWVINCTFEQIRKINPTCNSHISIVESESAYHCI